MWCGYMDGGAVYCKRRHTSRGGETTRGGGCSGFSTMRNMGVPPARKIGGRKPARGGGGSRKSGENKGNGVRNIAFGQKSTNKTTVNDMNYKNLQ